MSKRKETITLSVSLEQKRALESIAKKSDFYYGDNPNISALIRAIADQKLYVVKASKLAKNNQQKIEKALCNIQRASDALTELI